MVWQEVSDRDLATLAKRTLAYMKYLPVHAPLLPGLAETLMAATRDPLWHTRVATLNFLQVRISSPRPRPLLPHLAAPRAAPRWGKCSDLPWRTCVNALYP